MSKLAQLVVVCAALVTLCPASAEAGPVRRAVRAAVVTSAAIHHPVATAVVVASPRPVRRAVRVLRRAF